MERHKAYANTSRIISVSTEIQVDLNFGVLLKKTWTMIPRAIALSNDPEIQPSM